MCVCLSREGVMCAGGVCVDDFLDWLWCVVADLVVVWESGVVVSHHPSYQQPARTNDSNTVVW